MNNPKVSYFPVPYRDELFYSVCARFGERFSPNNNLVCSALFGAANLMIYVDFPTHLDGFEKRIRHFHPLTADQIVSKHSLLSLYGPFLRPENVKRLETAMHKDAKGIKYSSRDINGTLPTPAVLRFCPDCAQTERDLNDEAYWHRTHQFVGVQVCSEHGVWLEESTVPAFTYKVKPRDRLVSAERAIKTNTRRALETNNSLAQILFNIAIDIAWLADQGSIYSNLQSIWKKYSYLMFERGLIKYQKLSISPELLTAFRGYFSLELFSFLGVGKDEASVDIQMKRFVEFNRSRSSSPLLHLLFLCFLGCSSLQQLFELPESKPQFGSGPWPCMNPVCKYFNTNSIAHVELKGTGPSRQIGIFTCHCGFSYARIGPDKVVEDGNRKNTVMRYGIIWENAFMERWNNADLTVEEIARIFGKSPKEILSIARKLRLKTTR